MIYCKTINEEKIAVKPIDDMDNVQFIELTKYGDDPIFSVNVCIDEFECLWEFDMSDPSNYERVKFSIFDVICNCNTMDELVCTLDVVFREGYEDILIDECECYDECEDCCGYGCCEYLQ